jgi:hypothetical protein
MSGLKLPKDISMLLFRVASLFIAALSFSTSQQRRSSKSWRNPGTALYAGYTDGYRNLVIDPNDPSPLRRIASPNSSTGRQFFVKMSYLLRF